MKKRIATIIFMLLAISAQLWCGNHKFKSDYIDSLHTDVESHIYDKDVTKRIDKLMKASKEAQDDSHTEITVSDCGKGIPKDKSEWVFKEFTKVDDFTQGTGLGLAICREVMKRLNGSIHVDTNYTKGCRMVITLPYDGIASS